MPSLSLTVPTTPGIALISASFQLSGALPCSGRVQRAGIDHARQPHVDGILRGAVDLQRHVAPRHRLADQPELALRLELLLVDRRKLSPESCRRRRSRHSSDAAPLAGLTTTPGSVFSVATIDAPFLRRIRDQDLAHLRAGGAQVVEIHHHRAAAGDAHVVAAAWVGPAVDFRLRPAPIRASPSTSRRPSPRRASSGMACRRALPHLGDRVDRDGRRPARCAPTATRCSRRSAPPAWCRQTPARS